MIRLKISALTIGFVLACLPSLAQTQDERMEWWREARFGMFIHWGLYSELGGEWNGFDYGKEMEGASAEWIMLTARIPKDEYAALAKRFNPKSFDAKRWVALAKSAGMKYLIVTSKHHDGFSLFDTKHSDYNIIEQSPFGRDIVGELAAECAKQGLRFGVYYSQSKDWYHRAQIRTDPEPPSAEYQAFVKNQLIELLSNYGDISVLWFDTGDEFVEINSQYGELVRRLEPMTVIGSRLNGDPALHDFKTMADRTIPDGKVNFDAESPMTMRDNWGYDRDDTNWKDVKELLQRISLTVSRGANMLLNVGPTPGGTITSEETERLRAIGRWMDVNGEAVYGTKGSPFPGDFEWGSITQKSGRLFLHVLNWPEGELEIPGLRSEVKSAYLLADSTKEQLVVRSDHSGAMIQLPESAPDPHVSVVVLQINGTAEIDRSVPGVRHWNIGTGIRLNREKIEAQKKRGWVPW